MIVDREYIDAFKESVRMNIGDKETFFSRKLTCDYDESVYIRALYLGYLDACRTFKGQSKLNKEDVVVKDLAASIHSYLIGEDDFNHSGYCNCLVNEYGMSFGQAQKIVNMTFKYLYCLTDGNNDIRSRFDVCHMPLDSIMLEWLYRNMHYDDYPIVRKYIGTWSGMSENEDEDSRVYAYNYYQKILVQYCDENEKCQLQLDFENWRKMAQVLAAEEYRKAFSKEEREYGVPQGLLDMIVNI